MCKTMSASLKCIFLFLLCVRALGANEDLFKLDIIHFNDFHARFEETSKWSTKCNKQKGDCIGGFPRLYAAITSLKKTKPDAIVLDAGDSFQGTLWYNIFRWNVTQYFITKLPIDAHALGNHEFDHGIKGVTGYMAALKAPLVVSNMDVSLEPTMQGLYVPKTIVERKGQKIGIIGTIISTADKLADTEKLKFIDEVETVREQAKLLKDQGVNKIIVLSHSGLDRDLIIARELVQDIDVIVGGHTHSLLYTGSAPSNETPVDTYPVVVKHDSGSGNVYQVLIVQASAFTKYLGDLTVYFNSNGVIQRWEGSPHYLDKSWPQDETILQEMEPFRAEINEVGKRKIGFSLSVLSKNDCRSAECNLGSFITDAFVDFMVGKAKPGQWTYAAVSMTNPGALRADLPEGDITYDDLITSQPFGNLVQTFDLQGKYILEALEFSVNTTKTNPFSSKGFLQVAGLQITYDVNKPIGQRVVQAKVRCSDCPIPKYEPLNVNEDYKIVTHAFLAKGKSGFSMIGKHRKNLETWGTDEDVFEAYIKKQSPIYQEVGLRIKVL